MTSNKADIELALLYRKQADLEKEIHEVREAHKRNEYAKTNTYQLFVLKERLKWVNKKIARRVQHGE